MKLCFLGWGDHVHLERWAGYFASVGHEVSILSCSGAGRYPSGVRQHVLKFTTHSRIASDAELRFLLWRLQPDLLHAHWAHFAARAARVWSGPLAVTAWGSDIYREEKFSPQAWQS
ncbi:MAG TPA: glycosyltransferase, partial [Casimicrobiaceae bacterium]|nr:glycosyltransferase [Casimicrobiaceae bacterium]